MAAFHGCHGVLFARFAGRRLRWIARTWLGGSSARGRLGDASGVSMGTSSPVLGAHDG